MHLGKREMAAWKVSLWPQTLHNTPDNHFVSEVTLLKLPGLGLYEEVVLDLAGRSGAYSTSYYHTRRFFWVRDLLGIWIRLREMTDVFRGQFVGDLQYFVARREPQNRTCLCRAGASRRSLEKPPVSPPAKSGSKRRGCPGSGRRVLFPTVWLHQL